MKKIIIVLSGVLMASVACKKQTTMPIVNDPVLSKTVTLERDVMFQDQIITPPKSRDTLGVWKVYVGDFEQCRLTFAKLSISATGTFVATSVLLSVRDSVGATVTDIARSSIGVGDNSFVFAGYGKYIPKGNWCSVYLIADIGQIQAQIIPSLQISYTTEGNSNGNTSVKQGHTTTFAAASVSSMINATTPTSVPLLGGQSKRTLIFDLFANGQPSTIIKTDFSVSDASLIQSATLYDITTNTAVGTGIFSGTTTSIVMNVPISTTTSKSFALELLLKAVGNGQSMSNVKTSLIRVTYQTGAGDVKINDTTRTGNDMFVYRTYPIFSINGFSGSPLQFTNGVQIPLYSHNVKFATTTGSVKQFTYLVSLADNASVDTLILDSLKWFVNNVDKTSKVVFTNTAGTIITKITKNDSYVQVTYIGGLAEELITTANTSFAFVGTPKGFLHPNDGDGISIQLIGDDSALPSGYTYFNTGTTGSNAKLYLSPNASASAIPKRFIWSWYDSPHAMIANLATSDAGCGANGIFSSLSTQIYYQ